MKRKYMGLLVLVIVILLSISCGTAEKYSALRGSYMGQEKPGKVAKIFAPGLVSVGLYERDMAVSPDGKEIYFSIMSRQFSTIFTTRKSGTHWTEPMVASFATDLNFNYAEPAFSPDGKRIYFLATMPPEETLEPKPGWFYQNIWYAEKDSTGMWGKPKLMEGPVNTENGEYFPSFTSDGTIYFTRSTPGENNASIFRAKYADGKYLEPERLPEPVNGKGQIYNACISPDEKYLVACVVGRDEKNPRRSYYMVFFRNDDDTWEGPYDMGEQFNQPRDGAISINVSTDGKYIFFASGRGDSMTSLEGKGLKISDVQKAFASHGNNLSDIYWISSDVIKDIRESESK